MMLVVLFFIGFVFVNCLNNQLSFGEKIGLSFPMGVGEITLIVLLCNFFQVKINFPVLIAVIGILMFAVLIWQRKTYVEMFSVDNVKEYLRIKTLNWSWIAVFIVLSIVVSTVSASMIFLSTDHYDSITGYEYMAKVLANEGTFNNSIFDAINPTASIRHSYPPFVPGCYAIAFGLGFNSPGIMIALTFISLCIYFWSVLRKYTTELAAVFFTLLLFSTPQFIIFSSFSLTNLPHSFFVAAGLITLSEYIQNGNKKYLILATTLIAFNAWTRSDGIVFVLTGGLMMLGSQLAKKTIAWKTLLVYFSISMLPFIAWQLFVKLIIKNAYNSSNVFIKYLFWDAEKLEEISGMVWDMISSTRLYGIVFILFALVVILNIRYIIKDRPFLFLGIFLSFVLYVFLYYQMDNNGEQFAYTVKSMIHHSFKRGILPFIPLVCFYMATCTIVKRCFYFLNTSHEK